ncbi:hypothetical protein JTF12_09580 [Leclercia adecarboxylata]|uniref:hypothetical protein n=1 Tax=Leclercia adecarboxylata TaxID=83655 RepID=UPI0019509C1C|nr:hypothetical protein [Leclercia adecarboxylata]MBM6634584.1 hypothetical protein [Leclercia adecarboxylata]
MTTSKPMTGEQLDELMTVAVRMQRDAEADRNFPSANFAYAVQVAVLELRRTREISSALAAENAGLKKYICDECYVENVRTGHYACAGHGIPSTLATDAYLAEVRAQGVEMFAEQQRSFIGKPSKNDAASSYSSREAIKFADQLRSGVSK